MRLLRWLYPGIGVKRWLVLFTAGMVILGFGLAVTLDAGALWKIESMVVRLVGVRGQPTSTRAGVVMTALGFMLTLVALQSIIRSVYQAAVPRGESLGKVLFSRRQLEKGPKIVVIGGGTGLSVLLRGLKQYTDNITALVTVSDDGGSSGRLRRELGILPPGDIRNCLLAMADTEPLMERLFQYRFREGSPLSGHNFGNLFIAAMTEITGDFEEAVRQSSKVLAVRGRVLPSTLDDVRLCALLEDGRQIKGETNISGADTRIQKVYLEPEGASPLPEALSALGEADAIIPGPGSLYTSVLSVLAVPGIAKALSDSPAVKVYVCNVMTQPGETRGYDIYDHVKTIVDHCGTDCLDTVLVSNQPIPNDILDRYESQGARPVTGGAQRVRGLGIEVIEEHLLTWDGYVRHSPDRLARSVIRIILKHRGHALRNRLLEMYWLGDRFADRIKG